MGPRSARSKKRSDSANRDRKSAISSKSSAAMHDFYAPHITDPDPPDAVPLMTKAEADRAAAKVAKMFPELVMKGR